MINAEELIKYFSDAVEEEEKNKEKKKKKLSFTQSSGYDDYDISCKGTSWAQPAAEYLRDKDLKKFKKNFKSMSRIPATAVYAVLGGQLGCLNNDLSNPDWKKIGLGALAGGITGNLLHRCADRYSAAHWAKKLDKLSDEEKEELADLYDSAVSKDDYTEKYGK